MVLTSPTYRRWETYALVVKSAGLLLVEDFIKEINEIKENNVPDLIIISSKPFDYLEKDLKGNSLYDIEDKTKIKVEAI